MSLEPQTESDIDGWNSDQRVAYVNLINQRINASQEVSNTELSLALYACRVERTRSSAASTGKKSAKPVPTLTVDDL